MRDKGYCPVIYGPVQSRRHGLSLGVNVGDALVKRCTWGCLYCQCGIGLRVNRLVNVPTTEEIVELARKAILAQPKLDSVTLAGNCEPMSHPAFAAIVLGLARVKRETGGRWIFNVLSNGSELGDPLIRAACECLDEVWVKLDCATDALFQKLNRPVERVGSIDTHLETIARLKPLRLQTLLWRCSADPGLANATPENLDALLAAYKRLQPVEVHVTTIARDPAVKKLEPLPLAELEEFVRRIESLGLKAAAFA